MDTLEEYMFGILNFRLCKSEEKNFENMCIDNVLKNKYGEQVILLIIYQSVARRLGVRCEVVLILNTPTFELNIHAQTRYCIFWKPTYDVNGLENARCFNIRFEKFPDCLVNQMSLFITEYPLFQNMISRIKEMTQKAMFITLILDECSTLCSNVKIELHENRYTLNLDDVWIKNTDSRIDKLSLYLKNTKQLNTRPKDVKFAVGMIVTHDDQHTDSCVGVIVGWHRDVDRHFALLERDPISNNHTYMCDATCRSYGLPLNHCRNLNFEKQQTNYIILTESNKMCYVEEDAITLTTPRWIENCEIGRYFCKFEDGHYVPNEMLAKLYPQDAAVTPL